MQYKNKLPVLLLLFFIAPAAFARQKTTGKLSATLKLTAALAIKKGLDRNPAPFKSNIL